MFPCISRVWFPWFSSYSRVNGGEEEIELQNSANTTETDSVIVEVSSDSEDEDISENAVETDYAAYQGMCSNKDAICISSAAYSILRICDYIQLYLTGQEDSRRDISLVRRSLENGLNNSNGTTLLYNARNHSNHGATPQWVYPCSITPNATFPNGRQPFSRLNETTGLYDHLTEMNYTAYFDGMFDVWMTTFSQRWDSTLLTTDRSADEHFMFPYGIKGTGDFILRHFGDFTPQYPYGSLGISNELIYNGTCPRRIFNATHFFSGGYLGLEDVGFERLYPCGIHPDGLFTGEWIRGLNSAIPPNGSYPFGYFPNGTFPYVDYFFNPSFNHTALYWAVQRGDIHALQNYTRFVNSTETPLHYHPIPTNYTQPFASCYDIYPPRSFNGVGNQSSGSAYIDYSSNNSVEIDQNIIRAGLWVAQFGAEAAMFFAQNTSYARRRVVQALYLGTRTTNIIHSAIDLAHNLSHVLHHGPTEGQGQLAIRNMLTLTDTLNLVNEAIYFCTPAIQQLQQRVSEGAGATCLRRMCSPLQNVRRVVRNSLGRLTAIAGAVGVACTAGLGAALTADLINNDDQNNPEQKVILGAQLAVAAIATWALGWIARANTARANSVAE